MQRPDVRWSVGLVIGERTVVFDERKRPPRFFAPPHLKAERERRPEVVAREPGPDRHVAGAAVGSVLHDWEADAWDEPALIGNHQMTSGAQDTAELGQHGLEV